MDWRWSITSMWIYTLHSLFCHRHPPYGTQIGLTHWQWVSLKPRQKKDFELSACFIAIQSGLSLILCFCCNWRNYFSLEVLTLYLMVTECHIRFNLHLCHFLSSKMNPMRLNSLIKVCCHNSRWLPFIVITHLTTNTLYPFLSGTSWSELTLAPPGTGSSSIRLRGTLGADLSPTSNGGLMILAFLEYLIVPNETYTSFDSMDAEVAFSTKHGII